MRGGRAWFERARWARLTTQSCPWFEHFVALHALLTPSLSYDSSMMSAEHTQSRADDGRAAAFVIPLPSRDVVGTPQEPPPCAVCGCSRRADALRDRVCFCGSCVTGCDEARSYDDAVDVAARKALTQAHALVPCRSCAYDAHDYAPAPFVSRTAA